MVWQLPSRRRAASPRKTLLRTLSYSGRFGYPLTLGETWFWQIGSSFSKKELSRWPFSTAGFLHLKGADSLADTRNKRAVYSRNKWLIAVKYARLLSRIPTVYAIFITGSLAMNNSPKYDDVDVLIVARANSLWITRLLVILLLAFTRARRRPYLSPHSSPAVSDKICDNLYLDTDHLAIRPGGHGLYLAHEILQAKCVFDRGGVYYRFLTQNSWVKNYLPVAYKEIMKKFNNEKVSIPEMNTLLNIFLFTINCFLFTIQYLYMRPHLTGEKVSLGSAFFHPNSFQR
jgi:hypothetical protein